MTSTATSTSTPTSPTASIPAQLGLLAHLNRALAAVPEGAVALLARFSIAAIFWKSGQTKIEGLAIDLIEGRLDLGWPRLAPQAIDLFRDEYRLPLVPPEWAAVGAAWGEHLLPLLLLLGLATRLSALGLLVMTAVIQLLVYPGAWPTHGVWAALLLWLMIRGPGPVSMDAWLASRSWR